MSPPERNHLIGLRDGWSAWRWLALRTAGFPASQVLEFAAPASSRAIDRLLELELLVARVREDAIGECLQALDRAPDAERKSLRRRLERLRSGQFPEATGGVALAVLHAAGEQMNEQRRTVEEVFGRDGERIRDALRELARSARFREALTWQNRPIIATMLEPLLRAPIDATDAQTRRKEVGIAGYAQRYCVKNDTIGFFGPVGWARLVDDDHVAKIRPGETLLDVRAVRFEYWGMDALATKLAEDPELKLDLAPRRLPWTRVEGTTVHHPVNRTTELPADFMAVLAACDDRTPARTIAQTLSSDPKLGVSEDDVYSMLDELVEQQLIRWTLEIPTANAWPERCLRQSLERLPPSDARERALQTLGELEAARDAVAGAAGDATALDHQLRAFEERFSRLTGLEPARRAGQTYAGRTLLYEDTRRNVDVELGSRFLSRLAEPLMLVMLSARWYTHAVASAYREVLQAVYRELREQTGQSSIDYLQFLQRVFPHFTESSQTGPIVKQIVDELHARWMELLGVTPEVRRIERSVASLQSRVEEVFDAPGPGWPEARYHCPDIMIAAEGRDALEQGRFSCVVGEIHAGFHSYTLPVFANLHPDPDAIVRARRADVERIITQVPTRANSSRANATPLLPEDIDIEIGDARSWRAPEHVLGSAQLVVVEDDRGRLIVRTRDGRQTFDIVDVFNSHIQVSAFAHFKVMPSSLPHVPRITIDGLVVTRESWSFPPDELAFVASSSGVERFIGARRWAQRHGLPRFVFLRVPQEPKPCFVDLESPVYVDTLVRIVRQASVVGITEMLPTLDETWVVDAEGRTYTTELRIAVVDPKPWHPES